MPTSGTNSPIAAKFDFTLDPKFARGVVQIDANSHPELLTALLDPAAPLPTGDYLILGGDLSIAPGQDITVGPAKVGFSADVNAALGVFSSPASLRTAALQNAHLVSQIADALAFSEAPGAKFLLLRWGYDISGTAAGTVALAPAANLGFSVDADSKGYFAIVQSVSADARARASLAHLFSSWRLPSQVDSIANLPASTVLISEVDASFDAGAKVTFGYDFSWLRTVNGLGLKGDVGLKLQAGLSASVGFGISGKYAVVLSRNSDAEQIRLQLYKLRVNDWNFGFDASVTVTPVTPPLPENFADFLRAVTRTHGQQIMKLLGQVQDWTDPSKPVFGPFVNLVDAEAQKLIQTICGVTDLAASFAAIKARIQRLFDLWNRLPQTATHLLWSNLPDPEEIAKIAGLANQVSGLTEDGLANLLKTSLANIPFLNTTEGLTLQSLASKGLFAALQDTAAFTDIKKTAGVVSQILDGSDLQNLLSRLQNAVNTKLDLSKLESVIDQTSFDSLDTWLKARLEDFLEQKLLGPQGLAELQKLRAGLHAILQKKDELYAKALEVLRRDYEFSIHATYQKTTTNTALLDAVFDFSAAQSQAADGLKLALAGKFDQLLTTPLNGVNINGGMLEFGIHKESHVAISLPYFSTDYTHVNDAVVDLKTISADSGGLMFSLQATDLYTVKNDFCSALTIALTAPAGKQNVNFHSADTASYRYALRVGVSNLAPSALISQYSSDANTYFSTEFKASAPGRFEDWVAQITPVGGKFTNALLSLDLSLPSSAASAWSNAPADLRDKAYKVMSMALQRQFKRVLHDTYFSNLHNYANVSGSTAACAILAFCSIPPCSDVKIIDDGANIEFLYETAVSKNIYWDWRDRGENIFRLDLRKKILFHAQTQSNLLKLLARARTRLQADGDPDHVLSSYQDNQIGQILGAALRAINPAASLDSLLDFLFPVEANMVEQARDAGIKMASFRNNQFSNPERARKGLAEFGQKLSEDFNSHLSAFAVGNALMPLGTAIYAAAANAFTPGTADSVAAMFTVQLLKPGVSTLTPQDTDVLRTDRVVHAG